MAAYCGFLTKSHILAAVISSGLYRSPAYFCTVCYLQMKQQISNMEFGRRLATERDLEKSDVYHLCNIGTYVL